MTPLKTINNIYNEHNLNKVMKNSKFNRIMKAMTNVQKLLKEFTSDSSKEEY